MLKLYNSLLKKWGDPVNYWPEWCAEEKTNQQREVVALGAILVQRTSWHNAEIALKNLKNNGLLSIKAISLKSVDDIVSLVRVAGLYNTKPKRLIVLCQFIVEHYGVWGNFMQQDANTAREELLTISGIGPETADTILLYTCDKPTFVIDEYTKRFIRNNNLSINSITMV